MSKRHKLSRGKSGRVFRSGARRVHKINTVRPSRGGIRL